MAKYAYPAIFTPEEDGGYSVLFPDLEGCFTCGDNLADALFMAEDALALVLYGYEHDSRSIPVPSKASDITISDSQFVNFVSCDTLEYNKRFNSRAIKKTLSIPEWLNEAAIAMNINFSQVLQEALMQKVGASVLPATSRSENNESIC
ncbi:MAG: type II toxin-antitoxin system HicB family antitoxin [Acetatifactor sp.]